MRLACLMIGFLVLSGCGGGGGGTTTGGSSATPPAVTLQPQSLILSAGSPATFTVTASGTAPLSYQWRKGGTGISGATAPSFTIGATATADSGSYDAVVSNAAGTATSAVATLQVNAVAIAPAITAQPQSLVLSAGSPATFTVTASGTAPLSYQWRKGGTGISGATGPSYSIASIFASDAGIYDVLVSNPAGTAASAAASLQVTASALLDLTIPVVYITQSTQTQAFDVPLVKDRSGFLRAFVVADQANSAKPQVRVRFFDGTGLLAQTFAINAPGTSVPIAVDESRLLNSWNVAIPATYLQPGYKILVDVDPIGAIPESHKTNNTWPADGSQYPLDVRTLPPFRVTFWSVQTGDSRAGTVSSALAASFTSTLEKLWPINNVVDRLYGGTFTVADVLSDATTWNSILGKLNAKRVADGVSDRSYFGVVNPAYAGGIAGYSLVGTPTAIGWDKSAGFEDLFQYPGIFAHETGHNFGLSHAPCGSPANPDPVYPYGGASIGVWGTDLAGLTLKDPAVVHDIMSYCPPVWASDYNYKKVLTRRQSGSAPIILPAPGEGATGPRSLLLWGRMEQNLASLAPVFHMAVDAQPPEPGDQLLEGFDAQGRVLFAVSFGLVAVGDFPQDQAQHFGFSIPLDEQAVASLVEVRWSRAGQILTSKKSRPSVQDRSVRPFTKEPALQRVQNGRARLQWDATAHPMVLVRDKVTGTVLALGDGGDFQFNPGAGELELHFSDGLRSHAWAEPQHP